MPTMKPAQIKRGMKIKLDQDVFNVMEAHHVNPGKGQAFVRMRVKSLLTGKVLEKTFKISEAIEQADVNTKTMQFLYDEGDAAVFMDNNTYEQVELQNEILGDDKGYLKESMEVQVTFYEGNPIGVELPPKVDLEVTDTMDAVRGNTATNVTKDATVETGMVIQAPLFINVGDVVRISTLDGSYVERVNR